MYKKGFYDEINDMSYEKQKEMLRLLEDDKQAYDDSCNVIEVTVNAMTEAVKALVKLIF